LRRGLNADIGLKDFFELTFIYFYIVSKQRCKQNVIFKPLKRQCFLGSASSDCQSSAFVDGMYILLNEALPFLKLE
jgi:hypothetical protein